MRRVGMMVPYPKGDAEYELRIRTLRQELAKLGWTEGSNIQFDERWTTDDMSRVWADAASLVSLAPDVVVAFATQSITALQQVTRSIPIVFANVIDPVGAGFVTTLARPGGNTTGFTAFEYSLSGKWLELLKEIAPNVTRVAVLRDPTLAAAIGQYAVIQAVASSSLELSVIDIRDASEIERALASFAHEPNGGLIITASSKAVVFREQISSLATRYRLPNVYYARYYPAIGGLVSYGPDPFDSYRRAAGYVDRILKGEKPADLPVQTPTRYELVINLKTAKAIGLQIPPTLLARADEVIE
jgi:putative ABC transport system substrate-binding protein